MVYLDTHVVVFLYQKDKKLFSEQALEIIEKADSLVISPLSVLEMDYLREIGRLKVSGREIFEYLAGRIGLLLDTERIAAAIDRAARLSWTPDVFDRLITAQASLTDSFCLQKTENQGKLLKGSLVRSPLKAWFNNINNITDERLI